MSRRTSSWLLPQKEQWYWGLPPRVPAIRDPSLPPRPAGSHRAVHGGRPPRPWTMERRRGGPGRGAPRAAQLDARAGYLPLLPSLLPSLSASLLAAPAASVTSIAAAMLLTTSSMIP